MFWSAGVIAQPVLMGDAEGMSLRVIPPMLLHIACLTAKGEGCCSRIAGLEMAMKIRLSSFGLGGGPGRDLAGIRVDCCPYLRFGGLWLRPPRSGVPTP